MADTVEQKAEGRGQRADERRAFARISTVERVDMAHGMLRPGRVARVVDVSPGGALIETDCRLMPGMCVELQLGDPQMLYRVRGRIVRCHVALLDRERIRYRGALAFEQPLPIGGNARPTGSSCTTGGVVQAP